LANRAYLYSSNSFDSSAWSRPTKPYFDSRWNIPLAWFFFFSEPSIHQIDVIFDGSTWKELKLLSQKDQAIQNFTERMPLLKAVLQDRFDKNIVEILFAAVTGWSGNYLLVDPEEIFAGMESDLKWHIEKFTNIFRLLDANDFNEDSSFDDLFYYSGNFFENERDRQMTIAGVTYW
jgi:hypothetical protein